MIYFISCQDVQKPEIPTNLISQEDMVGILTDVYVSNAARNVNNKLLRNKNIKLDSVIFIKYKVDSLQFALSNDYYSSNLDIYRELLIKVQEKLKVLQTEKDSIYKVVTRQDSIINSLKRKAVKTERETGTKKIRD
ncbi:DUF4296 domain-containing protein [Flavobacteriaceae bacterium]|nr:DUF4296 domain-containing protein [Flavobacteriaceae bacterium]|tara:strand:- start:1030 stop:1437 length:408 start_codon:yes stop_codon:yes gene_type:complete